MKQHIIKASEFKAKCLQLMDEVNRTGDEIVITKNGKPVSKLVAIKKPRAKTLYGAHQGDITISGDIVGPLDVEWEAQE